MDAVTRLLVRRAFEHAYRKIKDGQADYICLSIPGGDLGSRSARAVISERIHPHHTLQDWVYHNVVPRQERSKFTYFPEYRELEMRDLTFWAEKAMRQYRLRWLKSLIAEFS